jgi:hypothetical protein
MYFKVAEGNAPEPPRHIYHRLHFCNLHDRKN